MLRKFIKRLFCYHDGIRIDTHINDKDDGIIISTQIQCDNCGKTFTNHPNRSEWLNSFQANLYNQYMHNKFERLKGKTNE